MTKVLRNFVALRKSYDPADLRRSKELIDSSAPYIVAGGTWQDEQVLTQKIGATLPSKAVY